MVPSLNIACMTQEGYMQHLKPYDNSAKEMKPNWKTHFVHEWPTVFRIELFCSYNFQNFYKMPNCPKCWQTFVWHRCQNHDFWTTDCISFFLVSNVTFVLQITSLLATVTRRVTGGMPTNTTPNTRILPTGLEWCNGRLQASCGSCYIAVGTHRAKLLADGAGMMLVLATSGRGGRDFGEGQVWRSIGFMGFRSA